MHYIWIVGHGTLGQGARREYLEVTKDLLPLGLLVPWLCLMGSMEFLYCYQLFLNHHYQGKIYIGKILQFKMCNSESYDNHIYYIS